MKQFLFRLFALGILLFVCLIGYIRFGAYLLLDNKDKASIITTIELAPELPERFYELYETAYPRSLGTKLTENFFWEFIDEVSTEGKRKVREIPSYYALILYQKL